MVLVLKNGEKLEVTRDKIVIPVGMEALVEQGGSGLVLLKFEHPEADMPYLALDSHNLTILRDNLNTLLTGHYSAAVN